jgi:DNA gyrase subunit A
VQGVTGIKLGAGDTLTAAVMVTDEGDEVLLASKKGLVTRVRVADVRAMGRAAKGVGVMQLGDGDVVQTVTLLPSAQHGQEGLGAE